MNSPAPTPIRLNVRTFLIACYSEASQNLLTGPRLGSVFSEPLRGDEDHLGREFVSAVDNPIAACFLCEASRFTKAAAAAAAARLHRGRCSRHTRQFPPQKRASLIRFRGFFFWVAARIVRDESAE